MNTTSLAWLGLGFALAYVNGANDVSKGIATLVGSGVTSYRRAIVWGTLWTTAGGLLGAVFARAMVTTFGNGLLSPGTTPTLAAALATLAGATAWVLVATRTGLPVSTTHAIVGAVLGVGAVAYGSGGVRLNVLCGAILLPLLVSPLVSLLLASVLLRLTKPRAGAGGAQADCLCVRVVPAAPALAGAGRETGTLGQAIGAVVLTAGTTQACSAERPHAARLTLDHLHWLTSGATSFARGMNDGPKIVALIAAAAAISGSAQLTSPGLFVLVTCGMALGSVVAGKRVTHVLAEKVTPMDHREGFIANLVTAGLVIAGATLGLPMSTTHVASGGIFGAGVQRATLQRKTLRDVAAAWIVTLPGAAILGVGGYQLLRTFMG